MDTETTPLKIAHLSPFEWGEVMKLARASSMLALEDAKKQKFIKNNMDASIMLYTDDPSAAGAMLTCSYMSEILDVSQIEGVAIQMGNNFPAASFEASRADLEMPRIAAMFFPAVGSKCPRCRKKYGTLEDDGICKRCHDVVAAL